MLALDLESAFDTMEPLIAKEAMLALRYHEKYINKYHEFTTGVNIHNLHPQKELKREIQPAQRNLFWDTNLSTE